MKKTRIIALILAVLFILPMFQTTVNAKEDLRAKATSAVKQRAKDSVSSSARDEKTFKPLDNNEVLRVIVELDETPAILSGKETIASVRNEERSVKSEMERMGIPYKALYSMDTLISGFSIEVERKYLSSIRSIPGVKDINVSEKYFAPAPGKEGDKPQLYASVDLIGAREVWNKTGYKGEGTLVGILDTGFDINHEAFTLEEGTPVKYTEEEMNALIAKNNLPGKYINSKVPYVYNYQDMTADSLLDTYGSRHGLHVAGIVGANSMTKNGDIPEIKGVAPHAQLAILKVFSGDPTMPYTYTDAQVRAIEDAIKLGCDSINLSLGSRAGNIEADDAMINVAFKNAEEAGIFVAVAQGNEATPYEGHGNYGIMYAKKENPDISQAGSPGISKWATSVASFENIKVVVKAAEMTIEGKNESLAYNLGGGIIPFDLVIEAGDLVDCGKGTPEDYAGKDLTGKVALVQRGGNTFNEKAVGAKEKGARGVIIFNNSDASPYNFTMSGLENSDFPTVLISIGDGERIKSQIDKVRIVFVKGQQGTADNAETGKMSSFSSWGSAPDLKIKPEITGPGGSIWSTDENDKYQSMSGTSMATPHLAGAAAIVSQYVRDENSVFYYPAYESGKDKEEIVRLLLMNTAVPMKEPGATYYNVRRQGAGLANLSNVVKDEVLIRATGGADNTPDGKVEFYATPDKNMTAKLEIKNYSNEGKRFTGDVIMVKDKLEASDLYTDSKIITEQSEDMNFESDFVGKSIYVPANSTETVEVSMDFSGDSIEENAFVEGFIRLIADSKEDSDLTVPYLAFYGDWNAPRIFDKFPHELADGETPQNISYKTWKGEAQMIAPSMGNALRLFNKDGKPYYVWNPDNCYHPLEGYSAYLQVSFALMRNAKDLKIETYDKAGKYSTLFFTSDYERKAWPGNTGSAEFWAANYVPYASDGETTSLKLSAKVDDENITERQEVVLPLLSDQKAPEIKDFKVEDVNGRKIVSFKLQDSTDIFKFGLQSVNEDGSLGKYIEVENFGDMFDTNDWRKDAQGNWFSPFADMIGEESYNSIAGFKNGGELRIDVTEIANSKELMLYVFDMADNYSEEFAEIGATGETYTITNAEDSMSDIKITIEGKENSIELMIKPGESKTVGKDTAGTISAFGLEPKKLYELDSFLAGEDEFKDEVKVLSPDGDNPQEFALEGWTFDADVTLKVMMHEATPKEVDEKGYPERRPYPIVAMEKPSHNWFISENDPDTNPQDDPEIVDGKLQLRGYVLYAKPEELDRVELVFQDPVNREPVSPVHIVPKDKFKEMPYYFELDDGTVVYDALSLEFEDEMPLPEDGGTHYVLSVRAINKEGKIGEIGLTIHVDNKAPTLNVKVEPREPKSNVVTFNYTIADDALANEVLVNMYGEGDRVYYKYHSLEEFTDQSGQAVHTGTFTYENLPEGITEFQFIVLEAGTARRVERWIGIYRQP